MRAGVRSSHGRISLKDELLKRTMEERRNISIVTIGTLCRVCVCVCLPLSATMQPKKLADLFQDPWIDLSKQLSLLHEPGVFKNCVLGTATASHS
eukprot:2299586-Amphidinium_carterae.1